MHMFVKTGTKDHHSIMKLQNGCFLSDIGLLDKSRSLSYASGFKYIWKLSYIANSIAQS